MSARPISARTLEGALRPPSALTIALSWLPVGAYTGVIWLFSSGTPDFQLLEHFPLRDKGVHFLEYGALAFLVAHAVRVTWPDARDAFWVALWLSASLGLSDELHQAYVPGRSADALDLLADTLGATGAIVLYFALRRLLARRAPTGALSEPSGPRGNEEAG